VTRLRTEGGNGEMLRIRLTDSKQEAAVIDVMQRERTDEYGELVETTRQFHEELQLERRRGRTTSGGSQTRGSYCGRSANSPSRSLVSCSGADSPVG
jgi:hypothetical protein